MIVAVAAVVDDEDTVDVAAVDVGMDVLKMRRLHHLRRVRGWMSLQAEKAALQARPDCDP